MATVAVDDLLAAGDEALAAGRWDDACRVYEQALTVGETGPARFGLASALWWLGRNTAAVEQCTRAYALFSRSGDRAAAVRCAVWLAITYKANFANAVAANGWLRRAERLAGALAVGPLHGWIWVATAYRSDDLAAADELSGRAVEVARDAGDVDLELVAMSQLGLIRVARGETADGFALIDEAVAATLAGERSSLDTVVYTCCDMLNACELADDLTRAGQWCDVADQFVVTYGCPFLYAECRIFYGSVLAARGQWDAAERELEVGREITADASPGLHARAVTRLAGLRVRQGRLEEGARLLDGVGELAGVSVGAELDFARAALQLAVGDPAGAARRAGARLDRVGGDGIHTAAALGLLVDAALAAADLPAATAAAARLGECASASRSEHLGAAAAEARGRVAAASGDAAGAVAALEAAQSAWAALGLPYELARARAELAGVLAADHRDAAVEQAHQSLSGFEALGAARDADRVAAFLRSLGIVPRVGPKRVGTLTGREGEVLELLAAGLSNPQIAARLHVTRKTAAHHVSSILAKLQLPNRAAAAAYAARTALGRRST